MVAYPFGEDESLHMVELYPSAAQGLEDAARMVVLCGVYTLHEIERRVSRVVRNNGDDLRVARQVLVSAGIACVASTQIDAVPYAIADVFVRVEHVVHGAAHLVDGVLLVSGIYRTPPPHM